MSRIIDRTLRPMFPPGFCREVQILSWVLAYDKAIFLVCCLISRVWCSCCALSRSSLLSCVLPGDHIKTKHKHKHKHKQKHRHKHKRKQKQRPKQSMFLQSAPWPLRVRRPDCRIVILHCIVISGCQRGPAGSDFIVCSPPVLGHPFRYPCGWSFVL